MLAAELVEDDVCAQVMDLCEEVSPAVAEAVSLALLAGAARGLLAIAREQGREGEVRDRIARALDPQAAAPSQN